MMRVALLLLALSLPLAAQPARPDALLPFHEIAKIVQSRIHGRPLAARLDLPRPFEMALGTRMVQEVTLLSPQGNIILVRLDAETGRVLELRGRGINAARVKPDRGDKDDRKKGDD